jgi:hypothetical protein
MKFAEKVKWEVVSDPVEEKGALKADKYNMCIDLANAMADKLESGNDPVVPVNESCINPQSK